MEHTFIMDNDSGYVSHNHDSSSEAGAPIRSTTLELDLNEDALLEKPRLSNFKSFDSVIEPSQESVRTDFSGFEEYESSFVIPEIKQIVYESCVSPDLFEDEEEVLREKSPIQKEVHQKGSSNDIKLLKNVQSSLTGLQPPPSVTIIQMSVSEMLEKINQNKNLFWTASSTVTEKTKSLLINDTVECLDKKWPDILTARYHGLHYNCSKVSEDFEQLCSKYAERYVGSETQSSCKVFDTNPPSSQKRKMMKSRWTARSPGRRLSHLARRRITFSSANLQASSSSAILGSRARQILVDARKLCQLKKSPKKSPRKTPSKSSFKIRKTTPSSSAKKKLAMRFRQMSGEFENIPSTSSDSLRSFVIEKKSTKRALFTSPRKSPLKRKRIDPLCSESRPSNRTATDTFPTKTEELSDQHKKKLQWAVYEALRLQNVTSAHPQYKVFASVLARVTRKFLPNLRFEGRTTEKMFRIARHHSHAVVKGKTVDEIVNEYLRNRTKQQKPQGYVGIEEFNRMRMESEANKENLQRSANVVEKKSPVVLKSRFLSQQNRIDKIKKVISFDDKES